MGVSFPYLRVVVQYKITLQTCSIYVEYDLEKGRIAAGYFICASMKPGSGTGISDVTLAASLRVVIAEVRRS